MKNLISLALTLTLTCAFVYGQQGKEKKQAAEKKAAEERVRSMGGYRTNNELKDDKGEITPANNDAGEDNIRAQQQEESTAPVSRNESQMAASGSETDTTEQSNAPAVIQRSTSEGGSPSVLSDNNGYGRDGTGNVQRAKPNMAGAEVPGNFNTAEKNTQQTDNVNGKTNVRKEEETPPQISSRGNESADQEEAQEEDEASSDKKNNDDKKSSKKKERENRRKRNKG